MRSRNQFRPFLLLVLFVIQCLTCMDLSHAAPGSGSDIEIGAVNCSTLASDINGPLSEELDSDPESRIKHRVFLVANSFSISDQRWITGSETERITQYSRLDDRAEIARIVSWLDKESLHEEATKSEPLWLRFQSLLI